MYSVNNNKTTKSMRDLASSMGYERISGAEHIGPGIRTDAEQILFNAVDDGTLANRGVVASSRPACGPSRQSRTAPPGPGTIRTCPCGSASGQRRGKDNRWAHGLTAEIPLWDHGCASRIFPWAHPFL